MAHQKSRSVESIYVQMGSRIADVRRERGLTQEDVARIAGLTSNYVARTEGAYHRATLAKLEAIAEALGVSLVDLFRRTPAVRNDAERRRGGLAIAFLDAADQRLVLELVARLRRMSPSSRRSTRA